MLLDNELGFYLKTRFFRFEQIDGTPMGSLISPLLVDIVMDDWKAIANIF